MLPEQIRSMPNDDLVKLQVQNSISPFLYDVASKERAIIASLIHNKGITKKRYLKAPTELFPWIKEDISFLEPQAYLTALNIYSNLNPQAPNYESARNRLLQDIDDTIEFEVKKGEDEYLVQKLQELKQEILNGRNHQ